VRTKELDGSDLDITPSPRVDRAHKAVDQKSQLIRTDGAISGSIKADILSYGSTRAGVIAGGPITAAIDIKILVHGADIIGSSVTGEVTIGLQLFGSIVATGIDEGDPNRGRIESVEVGYGRDVPEYYSNLYETGFIGAICAPVNPVTASVWYTQPLCPFSFGSIDSTIWAAADVEGASIGHIRVTRMTKVWQFPLEKGNYISRIESPLIEHLDVGDIREGVVWSALLEYDGSTPADDFANDYAEVPECSVGCIGPAGAVWYFGCPRAEVLHDVLGEVHLPTLEATETLWIGGRLGDGPPDHDFGHEGPGTPCDCGEGSLWDCWIYSYGILDEASPRDTNYAAKGRIVVRDFEGLRGQIIINGNNAGGTWDGAVIVGDELGIGDRIVITPNTSDPEFNPAFEAPHYAAPSGPLGGGAVGLVPYAFYPQDCTPPDASLEHAVMYTDFANPNTPVIFRWYGPVKPPTGYTANSLLNLHCQYPSNECLLAPIDSMFNFVIHPGAAPPGPGEKRSVGITAVLNILPKDGVYQASWDDASSAMLLCSDVVGEEFVGVFPSGQCGMGEIDGGRYLFRVTADCNGNDIPDSEDILNGDMHGPDVDTDDNLILDECENLTPTCVADWDQNGFVGVPDLFAFLSAWFAQSTPAYCLGGSGSPPSPCGVPAIFAFLSAWFATGSGPCGP